MSDLLPPNATALERALADATARISAVPIPLTDLWNPDTCPIELLPWLAWSLSIDRWSSEWSDARKRLEVAGAIAEQRRKGTRLGVELVLASWDELLEIVEWWEKDEPGEPGTFEVNLPVVDALGAAGGRRASAATAAAIVADIRRAKPASAHFVFNQRLELEGVAAPIAALQATGYRRVAGSVIADTSQPWSDLIQTETGEPIVDSAGEYLDGSAS